MRGEKETLRARRGGGRLRNEGACCYCQAGFWGSKVRSAFTSGQRDECWRVKEEKLRKTHSQSQMISEDWRPKQKKKVKKWAERSLQNNRWTTKTCLNTCNQTELRSTSFSESCSQWGATTTEKTPQPASPETPQDENQNFSEKVSGDVMWHFYFLLDEEIIFTVFSIPTRPPRSDDLMPNNQQTDSKPQRISRDGSGHGPLWVRPAERYYRFHSLMKPRYQPVSIILSGPQDKVR